MLAGLLGLVLAAPTAPARQIEWFGDFNAVNLDSDGLPMDAGFQFELGVFEGSFIPDPGNTGLWAANWRPAQRSHYNIVTKAFDAVHTVDDNTPPFTVGKAAYIWGWRISGQESEWILFRAPTWQWPAADPLSPLPLRWEVDAATAIIGSIHASGSPFLMRSAAVTGAASPTTTWDQWKARALAGETLNGPGDDPDLDGVENLLEFVFGTDPRSVRAVPAPQVDLVTLGGDRFLRMSVPRRREHPAQLVVEVSSDLGVWNAGPLHTEIVLDGVSELVARDRLAWSPLAPARFIRLRATLP